MAIDNTKQPPGDAQFQAPAEHRGPTWPPPSWPIRGNGEVRLTERHPSPENTQPPSATSDQPPASRLLSRAASSVLGQRERQHGDRQASFRGIAAMWNAYLDNRKQPDAPIAAYDVAWMMVLLKQQRAAWGDGMMQDHYLDAAAYAAIAWELAAIIAKPESDD